MIVARHLPSQLVCNKTFVSVIESCEMLYLIHPAHETRYIGTYHVGKQYDRYLAPELSKWMA